MDYDISKYPDGFDKILKDELNFLPDIDEVKENFLMDIIKFLIQM